MNVSAIIVTRGDVDLQPVIDSLPKEWQVVVWDNRGYCFWADNGAHVSGLPDLSVYGRYAAIQYASHDLIYVQDDDVIVSDPEELAWEWELQKAEHHRLGDPFFPVVVCNMPQEFRHDFYTDHALVGFGAAFHRDMPERAFRLFSQMHQKLTIPIEDDDTDSIPNFIKRTCDIIFTALTPRVLVDVPKENLPHAYADNRMWKQKQHQYEREAMLALALKAKEAQ